VARLFVTPREIDLISDLQKEINKDVVGAKIYYYSVREDLTAVHDVYEEALEKIFDPPIEIESRVEWQQREIVSDRFGHEGRATITAWIHYRDAVDRDLQIREGDYFSFGDNFFEIVSQKYDSIIFGQVEHVTGYFLTAKQARKGQIDFRPHGPTEENFNDSDAVQTDFKQQRGMSTDGPNPTGDLRQLQRDGVLDAPISNPREVKKVDNKKSSFYGDDC
jgi:hypothetical protein